jgi:hypothetical protein
MRTNIKLFGLFTLVVALSACGGGGTSPNPPPVSPNTWTWVSGSDTGWQWGTYITKGTANPLSVPGARYGAVSWIDSSGKLWLFGGEGLDSGSSHSYLNDLWKYTQ